ncbi:hypothetical protein RF11_00299 [Thelohanellus kitauei]|uniref:Uncharacterized protein n=1 Tax=Thelohanellus kitauei TaxID=669202 RepID=A0A0C2J9N0_THEKT|nr:hypothetical protein RF11_00299 [Thelohanellus kitauei]
MYAIGNFAVFGQSFECPPTETTEISIELPLGCVDMSQVLHHVDESESGCFKTSQQTFDSKSDKWQRLTDHMTKNTFKYFLISAFHDDIVLERVKKIYNETFKWGSDNKKYS